MKIDITGSNAAELMNLFQQFPAGRVIVGKGSAFWEIGDAQPQIQSPPRLPPQIPQYANVPPLNQPQQPNRPQPQKKNPFLDAFQTMAGFFED